MKQTEMNSLEAFQTWCDKRMFKNDEKVLELVLVFISQTLILYYHMKKIQIAIPKKSSIKSMFITLAATNTLIIRTELT